MRAGTAQCAIPTKAIGSLRRLKPEIEIQTGAGVELVIFGEGEAGIAPIIAHESTGVEIFVDEPIDGEADGIKVILAVDVGGEVGVFEDVVGLDLRMRAGNAAQRKASRCSTCWTPMRSSLSTNRTGRREPLCWLGPATRLQRPRHINGRLAWSPIRL